MALFKMYNHRFKLLSIAPYVYLYDVKKLSFMRKQYLHQFIQSFIRVSSVNFQGLTTKRFCRSYSKMLSLNSPQVQVERVPPEIKVTKNGDFVVEGRCMSDLQKHEFEFFSKKFGFQNLKSAYLEKYEVKVSNDGNSLCFPMDDTNGNVVAVQSLSYNANLNVLEESIFPRETTPPVFGWSTAFQHKKDIVITSNCLDAIAANQELDVPAVAVYFESETFPLTILKFFEQFQKIYFWFSEHLHNCSLHMQFAEKFGKKAFIVSPDNRSTALNCLQNGHSLKHILRNAVTLKPDDILAFSDFEDGVRAEFKEYEKFCGTKWGRFVVLNELLKGLRKGELTIFCGQSGVGKTTFMSEYSLDLCMEGVPTLWGSFEVKNTRLVKTMLTQFSRCNLMKEPEDTFDYWFSEFRKLNIFFMEFSKLHSIDQIISVMSNMVRAYGIAHIVIDNLQFMLYNVMTDGHANSNIDILFKQDQVFAAFRVFACQHNCHVTLVMHPRKEPELSELSITSISGTARATQEADNVLLLQTTQNRQYLQVKKNRFAGTRGCVVLEFDEKTLTYTINKIQPRQPSMPKR